MVRDAVAQLMTAYPVLYHALRQREQVGRGGARVSAHQATVLAHLSAEAGQTLTELATALGVALPTMSLLMDRLVRAGLVLRERDPVDGRRVALRLTEAGASIVQGQSMLDPGRVRALLATLSARERAAGVEGLITLARAARRMADGAAESPPSSKRGGT